MDSSLKGLKFLIFIVALPFLAGCAATLEDFQEMSSYERSQYICQRHQQVKYLASQTSLYWQSVAEIESALARGYRVHKSCKKVPVVKPLGEDCYYYGGLRQCSQRTRTDYETVCEEFPVAIDADLERDKLESAKDTYHRLSSQHSDALSECREKSGAMSAEAAFRYYESVK